jgi:outer membrane receptor for ferrienterochelin and colicin
MRHLVLTGVLVAVVTLSAGARAGEIEDFAELDLEELLEVSVYTAAKHEQDIAESPSAISVISREQIENTACTDVFCLLRQVPEVDVEWLRMMYVAVGARALTDALGDKGLVLVDGREINDEIFGVVYWAALPVHLDEIERIEVIRGPGSALYGANAHSLVVSITTRQDTSGTAEVFLGSGEHDRSSLNLRLGRRLGDFRLIASAGADTGGHFRIRDFREREIVRFRVLLDYETGSSTYTLDAGATPARGALYSSMAPAWLHDGLLAHLLLRHRRESLQAQVGLNFMNAELIWDIPLYFGDIKLGNPPDLMIMYSTTLDGEVQTTWSFFEGNLLIAGCNYRWNTLISDDNQPGLIHQHRVGVFLQDEQRLLEDLVLTGGLRLDKNSITPFTVSPRLAAVWHFAEQQYLRAAAAQAFRKPSFFNTHIHMKGFEPEPGFEELEAFFLKNIGNPDLKNESITVIEAGYRGRFFEKRLYVEATAFYNRYRDTITMLSNMVTDEFGIPDLANSQLLFENTGREVDTLGGSTSSTFQITRALRLHLNYTFRYSWYISDPGKTAAEPEESEAGDRVPWEPAHLFNLWFHYLAENGLRLGASFHGRTTYLTTRVEAGGLFGDNVDIDNRPLLLASAFASWRLDLNSGWIEAGVRAYNMLNIGFRDSEAIRRPDGTEVGGEMIGRRIFFFIRGAV